MASGETLTTSVAPSGGGPDNWNSTEWTPTDSTADWKRDWYRSVVPIMIAFCAVSLVTNLSILVSVRWVRRRSLNPTLCLSISLAVADAYASLCLGAGLLVNSLLPVGFDIHWGNACFVLSVEALRLAGLTVSALHLLMLAINHYIGIIRPLHYASTVTRRASLVAIGLMWALPLLFFFAYFASVTGEGYQSPGCRGLIFLWMLKFRVVVGCFFFVPLALMFVMYVHIFIIVLQHNRGLQQYQVRSGSTGTSQHHNQSRKQAGGHKNGQQLTPNNRQHQNVRSRNRTTTNSPAFRHNIKAALTTLMILGTYTISWMPAVLFFVVMCLDCVVVPEQVGDTAMFLINMINNTLMILKLFLNPLVYAARMKDIRGALQRMVAECLPGPLRRSLCGGEGGYPGGLSGTRSDMDATNSYSFSRSRNETLLSSIRMHSVQTGRGRSCSNRDSPTATLVCTQRSVCGPNGSLTSGEGLAGSKGANSATAQHQRNGSLGSDVTVTTYLTTNVNSTSCVADF